MLLKKKFMRQIQTKIKTRLPEPAVRGFGHILSCKAFNSCPNSKPLELDTLLVYMQRPIFCLTVASPKLNFLGSF
eukprot:UN20661